VLYYPAVTPVFFPTPAAFRAWLRRHHGAATELWVGFHKKASGLPSITYQEALDEALCYGWIDGVRKSLNATSFVQRWTPRRKGSYWSEVNIGKAKALIAAGRMKPPGRAAFDARDGATPKYSFEQRKAPRFTAAQQARLRSNAKAWAFFDALPPGYKRLSTWYVVSAKRPATQEQRLGLLIACSARGERLPGLPAKKK
jgi:uncharacterized protein YdeI (YjbR/CyaY-like superfamily)